MPAISRADIFVPRYEFCVPDSPDGEPRAIVRWCFFLRITSRTQLEAWGTRAPVFVLLHSLVRYVDCTEIQLPFRGDRQGGGRCNRSEHNRPMHCDTDHTWYVEIEFRATFPSATGFNNGTLSDIEDFAVTG
jgi:hypothetical protein